MNVYTIIDATGEQRRVLRLLSSDDLAINILEGESFVEGTAPSPTDWWDGQAWNARPAQPTEWSQWNSTTKEWFDPRTLAEAKQQKVLEINQARWDANNSTFTYAGKQIACDMLSRSDIDGVQGIVARTGALPPGFPGGWKAADNTYVSIPDVAAWDAFYQAMYQKGLWNFQHAQFLKSQVDMAQSVQAVQGIVWGQP